MKRWVAMLTLATIILTMLIVPEVAMAADALTKQDFVYTYDDETSYFLNEQDGWWQCFSFELDPPDKRQKMFYLTTNRKAHESDSYATIVELYGYNGILPYDPELDEDYQYIMVDGQNEHIEELEACKYYTIYTLHNPEAQILFFFNEYGRVGAVIFVKAIDYDDILASTGSSGETVRQIQQKLIDLGYLNDAADGKYGKKTADAVRTFQVINGLNDTGEVGAVDYDVMFGVSEKLISLTATPAPTKAPLPTPEPGVKAPEITLTELRERLATQTEEYGGVVGELKQLGGNAASFTVTTERLSDCKFIVKYDKNEVLQYVIADLVDVADGEIELEGHMSELGHIIGAIDPLVDGYDGFYILTKSVDEPYQQSGFVYTFDVTEEKLTVYMY